VPRPLQREHDRADAGARLNCLHIAVHVRIEKQQAWVIQPPFVRYRIVVSVQFRGIR
jgi:hypothetical protein